MSAHGGGPAFPYQGDMGMTLRDYFAAKAMVAALTTVRNAESMDEAINASVTVAYQVADAMLKAREVSA